MEYFDWPSISLYCVFSVFVFYQQLHAKDFQGESQSFGLFLALFAFTGMLTGLAYLVYYGWTVIWWAPLIIFVLGLLASVLGFLLEKLVGKFFLSIFGFVAWPVSAYFMFALVPNPT